MKTERSLKARAVDYLSRREHSRLELSRKLARHASDQQELEEVLADLERQGLLSNDRFAASLVHRRAGRLGTARIMQELRQHGVSPDKLTDVRDALQSSEEARARAVWQKRYGEPASDATQKMRQMRFLAARGFSHDVIRKVVPSPAAGSEDNEAPHTEW